MTIVLGIASSLTCLILLLLVRCSTADSFRNCTVTEFRANCTSLRLSHVPIIFNPRLTELTLRDTDIAQLGQSRPLEVYTRIEYLDLSQNGLAHIPDGAFSKQKVLRVSPQTL